jgi:predicted nucleic acid-binding protein
VTFVIDASVGFKWGVTEQDSDKAVKLRLDYQQQVHTLLAPDLFPIEITNVLLVAERRGRVPKGKGKAILADILADCPQLHASHPLLGRAYEIASATQCTAYDCLYVALAEQEGCELISGDERLVRKLQGQFPFVISLASLP